MTRTSRTLVTGFTAFGRFNVNPTALLAEQSGRPFRLLEVSYGAIDAFVESLDPNSFDRLLMLGVAGTSSSFRVEQVARNVIGLTADVRDVLLPQRVIDDVGPAMLSASLWHDFAPPALVQFSDDAGDYLCNYLSYRALVRFGGTKRVGFLHVPPVEVMAIGEQKTILHDVLDRIEGFEHA